MGHSRSRSKDRSASVDAACRLVAALALKLKLKLNLKLKMNLKPKPPVFEAFSSAFAAWASYARPVSGRGVPRPRRSSHWPARRSVRPPQARLARRLAQPARIGLRWRSDAMQNCRRARLARASSRPSPGLSPRERRHGWDCCRELQAVRPSLRGRRRFSSGQRDHRAHQRPLGRLCLGWCGFNRSGRQCHRHAIAHISAE